MYKLSILTILLLITGVLGFAQSLEIYETVNGQDVRQPNGTILTKEVDGGNSFSFLLKVKNVNSGSLSVFAKKVYLQILPGSVNSFCWDVCYVPSVMVSKKPIVIKPQEIVTRFDATYDSYYYSGDSRIRYVWFDGANLSDSVGVEVIFHSRPSGIGENAIGLNEMSAFPNPAGRSVRLNWKPTSSPGILTFHDLLGNKVLVRNIEGQANEVILDTSDFPDGLYFCMLESEGRVRVVKKIVIRH
jgi:Secretion system C-terminal sorting domain